MAGVAPVHHFGPAAQLFLFCLAAAFITYIFPSVHGASAGTSAAICEAFTNGSVVQKYLNCQNGGSLNCSESNATVCQCQRDWGGVQCNRCANDSACPSTNDTVAVCDTSPYARFKKTYQCGPKDGDTYTAFLAGPTGVIDLDLSPTNQSAFVQGWYQQSGFPSMFQCNLTQCTPAVESVNGLQRYRYGCQKTSCFCTNDPPLCPVINGISVADVFLQLQGPTEVTCDEVANSGNVTCTITPSDLSSLNGKLVLTCLAGECGEKAAFKPPATEVKPPDTANVIVPIVVIPAAFIVIALVPLLGYAFLTRGKLAEEKLIAVAEMLDRNDPTPLKLEGVTLTLQNVSYHVKQRQILFDINCEIRPGRMTAILGASGAGKTTTLDIIAGFEKLGKVRGKILLNGAPLPDSYRYLVGYVLQEDKAIGTLTVQEHLMYTALMRLPESVSYAEKQKIVNAIIVELGLEKVRHSRMGDDASRGISSGEMRRVSIATELVTRPRVLICDEPTSGLDAYNALSVMEALKRVADSGCTVIASIHQPRSSIFFTCDDALVLWNGKTVFSGKTKDCTKFLAKHNYECPPDFNVADFIIDTVTVEPVEQVEKLVTSTQKAVQRRTRAQKADNDGSKDKNSSKSSSDPASDEVVMNQQITVLTLVLLSYATNWLTQLSVLSHRSTVNLWRKKTLLLTHAIAYLLIALFIGGAYFKADVTVQGIQNRAGSLFFQVALFSFAAISSIDLFISERGVFVRERGNHCYRTSAYFFAKVFADIVPLRVALPIGYSLIVYWMIGYQNTVLNALRFIIVIILLNVVSAAFMFMLSASVRTVSTGTVIAVLVLLLMLLFGGLFLNVDSSPIWIRWIKYLSWMLYAYEGLVTNEMYGLQVLVSLEGINKLYVDGNTFLTQFGFDYANFGRDVAILAGFSAFYLLVAYLVLRFFVKYRQ